MWPFGKKDRAPHLASTMSSEDLRSKVLELLETAREARGAVKQLVEQNDALRFALQYTLEVANSISPKAAVDWLHEWAHGDEAAMRQLDEYREALRRLGVPA